MCSPVGLDEYPAFADKISLSSCLMTGVSCVRLYNQARLWPAPIGLGVHLIGWGRNDMFVSVKVAILQFTGNSCNCI
jgi:hypothetical protein